MARRIGGRRRVRRGSAFWFDALQRQAGSGLSVAEFCRVEGVSTSSFSYWLRKREVESQPETSPQLIPVEVVRGASGWAGLEYEVLLRGGDAIRVPAGFDEGSLTRLLRALEAARC